MSKNLKAVYENGIFRPLEPVDLAEHQEVTVTVPDARGATANHEVNCYDIAQQLGIVGMLDQLPGDLSTHRRHFEGFGQE